MARRQKSEVGENGTVAGNPPNPATEAPPNGEATGAAAEAKARPAVSFAANSDRTTRLEVAVWAKAMKAADGEEFTQHVLTLQRSWRAQDGTWERSVSYRAHDIPVLLYLIRQAHDWCVSQRTSVRTAAEDDLPF
jgi:hypothetical protein